jgi:hypothetical protein
MASGGTDVGSAGALKIPADVWAEFEPQIQQDIARRYEAQKAQADAGTTDKIVWLGACMDYVMSKRLVVAEKEPNWFAANISGFMAIAAVMTVLFGFLGLWGLGAVSLSEKAAGGNKLDASIAQSFLEIAKIFAGALVGAAGTAGAVALSKRK